MKAGMTVGRFEIDHAGAIIVYAADVVNKPLLNEWDVEFHDGATSDTTGHQGIATR
ncbi:hypothetical protein MOP88_04140 [Sphingomonas sp. WKB10]|nr:hypothetical protein [Sphingomonas sp. WKB10]